MFSRDHCERFSPSQISNTPRTGFEIVQNPSSDFVERSCAVVIASKYLSNFLSTLDMPLINCEINLSVTWSENCVLTDMTTQDEVLAQGDNPLRPGIEAPNATFKITDTKLHLPVITFSIQYDNKLLEQLKTGPKRTINWNKYRSQMSNQTKNSNLNYLIDPTFIKVNRLDYLCYHLKM